MVIKAEKNSVFGGITNIVRNKLCVSSLFSNFVFGSSFLTINKPEEPAGIYYTDIVKSSIFNAYYENIDYNFWRSLCVEKGELRHYEKGELFAEEGRTAKYIGYIKSGSLKYVVYAADGTERVVGLEFEGEFVADFPFSLYGKKSRVSILAVTPCDIYCIPTKEIGIQMKSDEELYRIIAETNMALFDTTYNRYIDLHIKSAKERYDELIEKHKDIFSIFSLKDIASFLNITPTHLSRLRKNDSI